MDEKREQVPKDEIAISNMISIEALVNILIAKGIVTQNEILDEIRWIKQINHSLRKGKS